MSHLAGALLAFVATMLGAIGAVSQAPAPRPVHGPGKLLAPVLLYRDTPDYLAGARYVVFFRAKAPFAGRTPDGGTVPGELRADAAWDGHDGYAGSIGPGTPAGKCYWWTLAPEAGLNRKLIGAKVQLRLKLHRTSVQRRSARLRDLPPGYDSGSWAVSPSMERDLATIGCHTT